MDVIHAALWVSDLEQTVDFYCNGLALEEHWEFTADGIKNLYVGGEHGEVQFKSDTDNPPAADTTGDVGSDDASNDASPSRGFDHLAIGVDSVDSAFDMLTSRFDPPVVKPPTTVERIGLRIAFVEDPDGHVVELVEALD